MMKRQYTIAIGIAIVIGGFLVKNFMAAQARPPKRGVNGKGIPTVVVNKVSNAPTPNKISISGKLMAENRIEIFAEVQGVLLPSNKSFKEGVEFVRGERMLKIDSTEFYLNLLSNKSSYINMLVQLGPDIKYDFPDAYDAWNAYVASIDINKPLPAIPEPKDDKRRNFLTSRDVYKQYFAIKSQEEKLAKYNLKAPFSGVLSEGDLQAGTMIRAGQKLGAFIKSGEYELEAAISVAEASLVKKGDSVVLRSEDIPGEWFGSVRRISEHIDQATQTIKVYIGLESGTLKEGMFLSGEIRSGGFPSAVTIQRDLLVGLNKLYTVKDSSLVLTEIDVLKIGENEVVVSGLQDGEVVMAQVFSAAYNGMKVSPKLKTSKL